MKDLRWIAFVVCLAASIAKVSAQAHSPDELPGLFEKLKSSDLETWNQASQELEAYGKWWIEQDVSTMRETIPVALAAMVDPASAVREQASAFFGFAAWLRPDDAPDLFKGWVDDIIGHFEDPNPRVRGNMVRSLALWRPAPPEGAIVPFIKALEDPSGDVRSIAAYGLVRAAPESDSAAQAIAETLDSLGPEARRPVIHSLALAEPQHPLIVEKLIEQLEQNPRSLRYSTVRALAAIGPAAENALPRLRAMAESGDTDEEMRIAVESALRSIEENRRQK